MKIELLDIPFNSSINHWQKSKQKMDSNGFYTAIIILACMFTMCFLSTQDKKISIVALQNEDIDITTCNKNITIHICDNCDRFKIYLTQGGPIPMSNREYLKPFLTIKCYDNENFLNIIDKNLGVNVEHNCTFEDRSCTYEYQNASNNRITCNVLVGDKINNIRYNFIAWKTGRSII